LSRFGSGNYADTRGAKRALVIGLLLATSFLDLALGVGKRTGDRDATRRGDRGGAPFALREISRKVAGHLQRPLALSRPGAPGAHRLLPSTGVSNVRKGGTAAIARSAGRNCAMRIDCRCSVLKVFSAILAFVAVVARPDAAAAQTPDKVTVCHIPPGNPANAHTISVDAAAVPAHLGHGDTLTPCEICLAPNQGCGGPNGNCCAGTMCEAGVCVVPMCIANGGFCNAAAPNCCPGLSCNIMFEFCFAVP
jgi:hypothetical protein